MKLRYLVFAAMPPHMVVSLRLTVQVRITHEAPPLVIGGLAENGGVASGKYSINGPVSRRLTAMCGGRAAMMSRADSLFSNDLFDDQYNQRI